jgi:hypothetical protein
MPYGFRKTGIIEKYLYLFSLKEIILPDIGSSIMGSTFAPRESKLVAARSGEGDNGLSAVQPFHSKKRIG